MESGCDRPEPAVLMCNTHLACRSCLSALLHHGAAAARQASSEAAGCSHALAECMLKSVEFMCPWESASN